MASDERDALQEELEHLRRRVEVVERRLGLGEAESGDSEVASSGSASPAPPVAADDSSSEAGVSRREKLDSPYDPRALGDRAAARIVDASQSRQSKGGESRAASRRAAMHRAASPRKAGAAEPAVSLERFVGGQAFAIFGALAVIAGAALGLKYAWDQGWLGAIPDGWKCIISAAFGFGLIGAGEWARRAMRQWGAWAASGLMGAGVGTVYATAFAAYALFDLLSPGASFALLGATAILGFGASANARLVAVAIVSLIGGYLAPLLILRDIDPPAFVLPAYWTMLLVVSIGLSAYRRGPFTALRTIAWWGTVLFGGVWTLVTGVDHPIVALPFLALVWVIVHAELIAGARRNALTKKETLRGEVGAGAAASTRTFRPLVSSVSLSAWTFGLAYVVLKVFGSTADLAWLAPAAGAAITGHLALALTGSMRVVREPPRNDIERLGAAFAVTSGALLVATIAAAAGPTYESISWMAIAVASAIAARWMRARALAVYAAIVLAIASHRILLEQIGAAGSSGAGAVESLGLVLTTWSLLMAICGLSWFVLGALFTLPARTNVADDENDAAERLGMHSLAPITGALGALALGGAILHSEAEASSIMWMWLALCIALRAGARWLSELRFDLIAPWGLLAVAIAWAVAHRPAAWSTVSDASIGAHPGLWSGLCIAIVGVGFGWWGLRRSDCSPEGRAVAIGAAAGGVVMALGATSLEVARAAEILATDPATQRSAVSIWWGVFALGLLAFGFARRIPVIRWCGLGLLTIAMVKVVIFDLASVPPGWRVASFLGLGLGMLGVALAYARLSVLIDRAADASSDADGADVPGVGKGAGGAEDDESGGAV